MSEQTPNPIEGDPSKEPLTPQTAFLIIRTGQLFSDVLLGHAKDQSDWQVMKDVNNDPKKPHAKKQPPHYVRYLEMQYTGTKGFLGDITEWDTKLFSFSGAKETEDYPLFTMRLPLEPTPEYTLEVNYDIFGLKSGGTTGVCAKLPYEGQGLIEHHSTEWRTMTQGEGLDLLTDLTILTYELHQAVENGAEF